MGSLYADVVPWRRQWTDDDRWIRFTRPNWNPNGVFLYWHVGPEHPNDWNIWYIFEVLGPPWGGLMGDVGAVTLGPSSLCATLELA